MTTLNRRLTLAGLLGLFAAVPAATLARPKRKRRKKKLTPRQKQRRRIDRNRRQCGSQWRRSAQVPQNTSYCYRREDADLVVASWQDQDGLTHTHVSLQVDTCQGGVTIPVLAGDTLRVTDATYCLRVG